MCEDLTIVAMVSQVLLDGNAGAYTETLQRYQVKAEYFLCAALQKNHGKQLTKSPGMAAIFIQCFLYNHLCVKCDKN